MGQDVAYVAQTFVAQIFEKRRQIIATTCHPNNVLLNSTNPHDW